MRKMNRQLNLVVLLVGIVWSSLLPAQMNTYSYKRSLHAVQALWNKIELPDSVYGRLQSGFNDLRIYSIDARRKDTLEMPYILSDDWQKPEEHYQAYHIINRSSVGNLHYFTIQVDGNFPMNRIQLNFEQTNFDWRLQLEGSHDQKQWFTLQENYRLVAIQNELTDYRFSTVDFSESVYRYYRVCIRANEKPRLKDMQVTHISHTQQVLRLYAIISNRISTDRRKRQTVIELNLPVALPVNQLRIKVKDKVDYYRPMIIEYQTDSFRTEKSWYYNYEVALEGTMLSSLDSQIFRFPRCITRQLRITIDNQDNQLLTFTGFEVAGIPVSLIARINRAGNCYLCYGRKDAAAPQYDLLNFGRKIPLPLHLVQVGSEQAMHTTILNTAHPLFENKLWLWLIMGVIITLLIVFSLKMLKKS
ncbi:MAG: hypothetical protein RIS29_1044 [Bacteroidota bacterium]